MSISPRQLASVLLPACASAASVALAHVESGNAARTATDFWTLEAWVIASLLLAAGLYASGLLRLWSRAGRGAGVGEGRAACFAAGLALLCVALLSPLDALGAELFSAHMVQHEVIMLGAAPLLVAGRPLPVFLWAFPERSRHCIAGTIRPAAVQQTWRTLSNPFFAWSLHLIILWAWHFPRLFQAGLESELLHAWQHACFLISALLFWSSLSGSAARHGQVAVVLSLLTTAIHTGILGALLTFSTHAWYPAYTVTAEQWGMSALEDQQLGGLIMWVPAGFLFIAAGLAAAAKAIGQERERPA